MLTCECSVAMRQTPHFYMSTVNDEVSQLSWWSRSFDFHRIVQSKESSNFWKGMLALILLLMSCLAMRQTSHFHVSTVNDEVQIPGHALSIFTAFCNQRSHPTFEKEFSF